MPQQKPPRLLSGGLTGKVYIVTAYNEFNGKVKAVTKHEVQPRDLLDAVYALGVRGEELDKVADRLGFVPTEVCP